MTDADVLACSLPYALVDPKTGAGASGEQKQINDYEEDR